MSSKLTKNTTPPAERMRFGIYARYSSEMQNDISLEDQERFCRRAVADMGGTIVKVYKDGATSGWAVERPGLDELRHDAAKGKLDAIMLWKFDRLMRDHDQTVVLKLLLRKEYGLKLFCVEGFSEDEDDSPYAAMMEQMLAIFAAFYSKNLSIDAKRRKRSRAEQGKYNGSEPPFGFDLVTEQAATPERPAGLHINCRQAALVRRAFKMYATGDYYDGDIADWLNQQPLVQKIRQGQQPYNRHTVRDLLQNKHYTGRVCHADTQYKKGLGQGRRASRGRKEWFEGLHAGFIADELMEQCQEVRKRLARLRKSEPEMHTYVLQDRVYCARCVAHKPIDLDDPRYGKMGPFFIKEMQAGKYQCKSKVRGYKGCGQPHPWAEDLDNQLVDILACLHIPDNYRARIEEAVRTRVEHEAAYQRMEEIHEILKRMDFRWDNGLILNPQEYMEQRKQLMRELESLRPIDYDQLIEAADLLSNFRQYWDTCAQVENPAEARQQLVGKVVERVFVEDHQIVGVVLHGDFAVILQHNEKAPNEIIGALAKMLESQNLAPADTIQCGSDGVRSLAGDHILLPLPDYRRPLKLLLHKAA